MTSHACTSHRPGTPACYSHCGCRCDHCRRAKSADHERWRLRRLRGEALTVPSLGTVRRLRALSRVGWTHQAIGREIGMARNAVTRLAGGAHSLVFASTATAVAQLYERGWNGPAELSQRAINHALRQGWRARPIDWDDEALDDPAGTPWAPPAGRVHTIDVIADAAYLGCTATETAAALGIQRDTVYATCRRHDELDLWERLTRQEAS